MQNTVFVRIYGKPKEKVDKILIFLYNYCCMTILFMVNYNKTESFLRRMKK